MSWFIFSYLGQLIKKWSVSSTLLQRSNSFSARVSLVLKPENRQQWWGNPRFFYHLLLRRGGGGFYDFPKIFQAKSWTKMSKMSINTVKQIDEVEQISLLTTCTIQNFIDIIRLSYSFLIFPEIISGNPLPFITFARVK